MGLGGVTEIEPHGVSVFFGEICVEIAGSLDPVFMHLDGQGADEAKATGLVEEMGSIWVHLCYVHFFC